MSTEHGAAEIEEERERLRTLVLPVALLLVSGYSVGEEACRRLERHFSPPILGVSARLAAR